MLLLKGIEVRNLTVNPFDKNPYIVKTPDGEKEVQTTKLIIGNLPISYSNDEIERKLLHPGCEPQSKLMMERDRDERGGLTTWLTGRRFVYIRIPDRALPEKITIGSATATLYHREQKNKPENSTYSRCFTKGHLASSCTNDIVCRTCKQPATRAVIPPAPYPPTATAAAPWWTGHKHQEHRRQHQTQVMSSLTKKKPQHPPQQPQRPPRRCPLQPLH